MSESPSKSTAPDDRTASAAATHEQFLRCYTAHQKQIYAYLGTFLRDPADVDDVLQETSIILWHKWDSFRPDGKFLPWACGIAYYEMLKFCRQQKKSLLPLSHEVLQLLAVQHVNEADRLDDRREALRQCLTKLQTRDQSLLQSCYGSGLSIKRVAGDIGRPVNSVYQSLSRIRGALYQCINRALSGQEHA